MFPGIATGYIDIFSLFLLKKYHLSPLLLSREYGIIVSAPEGYSRSRKTDGWKRKNARPAKFAERADWARRESDAEVVQAPPERKLLRFCQPDGFAVAVAPAHEGIAHDAIAAKENHRKDCGLRVVG